MGLSQLSSTEIYQIALKIMPGGVSSPVRALSSVGGNPIFMKKAEGAYFWDVDKKKYLDLCMSFGPLILGHAHPKVIEKVSSALLNGTSFGTSSVAEVELAEKITKSHPAINWVRFVNSGTEAVMSAIRLARAYTKRDLIIKFEGGYHGHADSMLVKAGSGLATFGLSSSDGVPQATANNTIVLPLADPKVVEDTFEKHGSDIAAVIIEGVPANNGLLIQTKEFMQNLQKKCRENGTIFILDEVITGFRIGLGGATDYYGLQPDIVTLGKIIGGGLPIGAYGGRPDLMELVAPNGPMYQAGTLSGNPIAMAAGNATIDELLQPNFYDALKKNSDQFGKDIVEIFDKANIPFTLQRIESIVWPILESNAKPDSVSKIPAEAVKKYSDFHQLARREGIYFPPSAYEVGFLSTAHDSEVVTDFTSILERVISKL